MMENTIVSARSSSLLSSHRVLRNTYGLLAMTLACSALAAWCSALFRLPSLHPLLFLGGSYGLLFLTQATANSGYGILSAFAFTGFVGYGLGPGVGQLWFNGASDIIITALGGTSLVFFGCSTYILTTKKDMSFISGMLTAGAIVLLISMLANLFLKIPSFSLAISALFILFSSGIILLQTSAIIHGGETNYIRATIGLYVSIYNLFISLIHLLGSLRREQ